MKILRIRLENLNSLKGTHEIDLTAEPLASAGLFAITGPTGAGKTTLLDAVTLALYGRAARYGNESNPENMMSRHCGECSAEVEFEVSSGKRAGVYRAVWERHRARKKPDGALQQPKRYIYDESGEPMAQKISEAERLMENLIGLDYERFLRSALLAQGEFARFLKANANERAELLESLTGTEIYSRLGRLAHTESVRFQNEMKEKEALLERIEMLDKEARSELESSVKDGAGQLDKLEREIKSGGEMLKKIEDLSEQRRNASQAREQLDIIARERAAAAQDLEALKVHRATEPFAEDLGQYDAAANTSKAARGNCDKAEIQHREAKAALTRAVVSLRSSVRAALAIGKREAEAAADSVRKESEAGAKADAWLADHKGDAELAGRLGDLVAAVGDLKSARGALSKSWLDWRSTAAEILPAAAGSLPDAVERLSETELRADLDAFLAEAGKEKSAMEVAGRDAGKQAELRRDHLDKARLVAKLEDHRHRLVDGEPCPLCGALSHPYAEGGIEKPEIAALEEELRKAEQSLKDARDRYMDFERVLKRLSSRPDGLFRDLRSLGDVISRLELLLRPFGLSVPESGREFELREGLQQRESAWRAHLKRREDAGRRLREARRSVEDARRTTKTLEEKLGGIEAPTDESDGDAGLPAAGDLPSVPEAERALGDAAKRETTAAARLSERRNAQKQAEARFDDAKRSLESRLSGSPFGSIDTLRKARLSVDVAKKIEELGDGLNRRFTAAQALEKQAGQAVARLVKDRTLEGDEAAEFKRGWEISQKQRDELLREQTRRKTRIESDDANRKLRRKSEKELKADRKELAVWSRLRELIGSHDGSKFRRYAQTISLDILARHANRHLARLSERYRIRRDEEETLNLQIEDLHQAGVRRPMASLSGGESFLVSLALALGLAELAGRTVRIDSLFIDEGFGSLDPETLETAISALESLRQSRKTVGVISHVHLLRERIATRIAVEKIPGGWSKIVMEGMSV